LGIIFSFLFNESKTEKYFHLETNILCLRITYKNNFKNISQMIREIFNNELVKFFEKTEKKALRASLLHKYKSLAREVCYLDLTRS